MIAERKLERLGENYTALWWPRILMPRKYVLGSQATQYSCLQNPWRELPRSGCPTNFWLQRLAMADEMNFSNVDVINCVDSFLSRLEMKLFNRRCLVDI